MQRPRQDIGHVSGAAHRDHIVLPCLPAAWQCDLATDALRWTTGVFDLFGLQPGTPIDRRDVVEMYCGESRAMLDRLRANALVNCSSFTFEAQIRRPDGELRWMLLSADVVKRDGRARLLYGTKRDITDEMTSLPGVR